MRTYLDTSVVLRHLFQEPGAWKHWAQWSEGYVSELMGVEARRTIDRMRLTALLDDEGVAAAHHELARVQKTLHVVACTRATFSRASMPMPTVVRTLDAVHLATALLLRESGISDLSFVTHDVALSRAALGLGFETEGTT